jgi:hypothetical protein
VRDEDSVAFDGHVEGRCVVGPKVERGPGRQVEPSVMPVTGQQAVIHGAAVQREPHVGAAVLDRPGTPAVPEDHDWRLTDLPDEAADPTQLGR